MVVDNLYYNNSDSDSSPNAPFTFSDEVIRRALLNIYSQDFHPVSDIEQNLFNEVWRTLNIAADRGFGQSAAPAPDDDFRNAIRRSNAVFSAFKVHRLQNDMAQLLLDDDGNLKTFEQWRKEAQPIASHQCGAWLRTEYDTAVIRAHQAADWLQFQQEKDVLPNLRWVPSTSPNPGKDHRHFWNTILPIDDPFWTQHRPGDRWNCKCSLTSTDEPPTAVPATKSKNDRPQPGLDNNPATDRKLFADSHPYIAHPYHGAQKAVNKLMEEIDTKERQEKIREIIRNIKENYPTGESLVIGKLKTDVKKFLSQKKVELLTDEIYITDKQIRHALRPAKQKAGKSVTPGQIEALPSLLDECEVYWDELARNIQFVTHLDGKTQKFVIALNYRTKIQGVKKVVNAFITAGIIEERNLNMQNIKKIK